MVNYPDIYFTPEYSNLFAEVEGGESISFHYCSQIGEVYYPFILRPIIFNNEHQNYYDIISPYGYGGPIILTCEDGGKQKLLKEFDTKFSQYCFENRIISEFVRFHPLLKNFEYCNEIYQTEFNRHTVVIDMTSNNPYQDSFTSKCRNTIQKAQKNNVKIEFDFTMQSIEKFHSLYTMTMQKNYASNYYFFDEQFFKKTMEQLQDHIVIVNAIYNNEIIGTAMFMYYGHFLHYHFSATNPEYYKLASNNLILSEMTKWGKQNGINYFHLGGGYTTDPHDSLLSFKKSFSKKNLCEFWIGKRIRDFNAYQRIVELTLQNRTNTDTSFFPLYRSEIK
jgi:hypothetical protein